jgi:guanosine-3',5'-bis(diphosphate) 3'-pyrophosphohydrolase
MSTENGIRLVLKAATFAAEKHRTQRRKDAEASPYINHPLALAHILCSQGGITDPTVLAAALLHDTMEDTETSFGELEREFGPRVAGIVAEVTDDKSKPKHERKRLQVTQANLKSDEAKLVKLADKISNLRDIIDSPPADWSLERRQDYFDWAEEVVKGLRGVSRRLEDIFDEVFEEGSESIRDLIESSIAEHPIPERLRGVVVADLVSRVAEMGRERPEKIDAALAILRKLPEIQPDTELEITWYASGARPAGVTLNLNARRLELTMSDEDGSQEVYCCDAGSYPDIDRDDLAVWLGHLRSLDASEVVIDTRE